MCMFFSYGCTCYTMYSILQVKQAMSSSQSVAVSVPTPVSTGTNLHATSTTSADTPGGGRGGSSVSESSQTTPHQQQQQQQSDPRKAQQNAALKQVKLTTMKHPPGIDPETIMKERESRLDIENVTHSTLLD